MKTRLSRPLTAVLLSGLLIFQLVALTGCGGGQKDNTDDSRMGLMNTADDSANSRRKVNLTLWGAAEDQALLKKQCDDFCRQYQDADVSVTIRTRDEDSALDMAINDGESTADVFAVRNSQLEQLVRSGAVGENTLFSDQVSARLTKDNISIASVDGKLYGYPCSSDTCIMFYDKSKLERSDISSLESILKKIRNAEKGMGRVCPFAADFSDMDFSSSVFLTAGIGGSDTRIRSMDNFDFSSDNSIEAARYIAALDDMGVEDLDKETAAARFKAGTLAAYAAESGCADMMYAALGDNCGAAELPTIRIGSEDRHLMSFSDGSMYVVKSSTSHPHEAAALANYLTSDECQLDRFGKRNLLPSSSGLTDNPDISGSELARAMLGQMEYTVPSPAAVVNNMWDSVANFGRELFGGKVNDKDIKSRLGTLSGKRVA